MTGIVFCRSDFSLGESLLKVEDIAKIAKQKNYSAVSLTDTMTLSSLIEASNACSKQGVHLIAGVRLRVVEDASVKDKKQNNRAWYPKLMFKNEKALDVAYKLLTIAGDDNHFYYVPRLSFQDLLDNITEDCFISFGDQNCGLGTQLAEERMQMLINKIGAENIGVECIPFDTPIFDRLTKEALCAAEKYGVKLIYSDLCFYSTPDKKQSLIALNAITAKGSSATIATNWLNKPTYSTAYIKDFLEYIDMCKSQILRIRNRYGLDTSALVNAIQYTAFGFEQMFTYKWEAQKPCLPQMAEKPFETLKQLCKDGFQKRLLRPVLGYQPSQADLPKYVSRLQYELGVIEKLDFSNYFLLVKDILDWARKNGIPTGPGRGSAGGSIIAFLLDITDVDPLRFDLMFERFINPDRIDLPDVDMDISSIRRQDIINRIYKDYGEENVASISNYITLGAAGAIRACGRAFDLPINAYSCSTKVPSEHGVTYTLEEALQSVPEIELFATKYPEVWKAALDLEGCIYTYGIHAAGLIVAGEPLIKRAVVEKRSDNKVVCWDKRVVESMGLIKMDLLGLSTLDTLSLAKNYIKESFGVDLDLLSIPLDDKKTLEMFSAGKTSGIFQFESAGGLLKRLAVKEPLKFEDLVAATALNRPGPMDSGLLDDYVAIKQGLKTEHYDHPNLKDALKETFGIIVYQEQVMKASIVLAGFTPSEADFLRKAMGKKDKDKMASMKNKWIQGCQDCSGMNPFDAEALWNKIEAFAGYGFNKSHAVEYTLLSFMSMYIKTYYPTAFYAAILSTANQDKLNAIVKEAEVDGITLLPPDINEAVDNFLILDDKTIMIPFNRIKGLSNITTGAILEARKAGKFSSMQDFINRVEKRKCNVRHQDCLNRVGAFANIEPTQAKATDITRVKDQYELLPGLITKNIKSTKRITGTDIKKELDKNNVLGQGVIEALGKTYVKPYSGRVIRYVVIFDSPNKADLAAGKFAANRQFEAISEALITAGVNKEDGYWTGLLKTAKENSKEITAEEFSNNLPIIQRELQLLKPEIIVLMGTETIKYFAKDIKKPSEAVGQSFYDPNYDATFIIGLNPGVIYYHPEKQKDLNAVFQKVANMIV